MLPLEAGRGVLFIDVGRGQYIQVNYDEDELRRRDEKGGNAEVVQPATDRAARTGGTTSKINENLFE